MLETFRTVWPSALSDPIGQRASGNAAEIAFHTAGEIHRGQTMILDKGLGRHAFMDLLEAAGSYIDCIKIGFGTAPLYPAELLLAKIELAKRYGLTIMPGGTLLEAAVQQRTESAFFDTICRFGFNGIEVSDGTIELSTNKRSELIREGARRGLRVVTEYGKKLSGSLLDAADFAVTAEVDFNAGADLITLEARESGCGVGLFDENGQCREDVLESLCRVAPDINRIMWEAPLKHQQLLLLRTFGADVHLGNIPPAEAMALETMRRGLRADTFDLGMMPELRAAQKKGKKPAAKVLEEAVFYYMI